MNRPRFNVRTLLLVVAEAALLYGSVVAAAYIRLGIEDARVELFLKYGLHKAVIATIFCLSAFYLYDLYDFVVMHNRRELVLRLIQALGFAWVALAGVFYVAPELMIGRGVTLISSLLALMLMVCWRISIHWLMGHPSLGERILIIGSGDNAIEIAREALERRDAGYRIIGFVDNKPELVGQSLFNPRVIGLTTDLEEIVRREKVDRVVVALGEQRGQLPMQQLLDLSLSGDVAIDDCASFFEKLTGRVHLEMMRPSWLIFTPRKRKARISGFVRAVSHRGLALVGAVVSLPIAIITAILIKLDSPGPVLYSQERVGKNDRVFKVLKFRSMRTDAEKNGPVWANSADNRVTRVGRIIRKIRVDEIPQFWNILKGEMSFIGPRPERPHFVAQLADEIPYYEQRHLVAPGLTGWAQIKYPYGSSIEDARQKLQYDLYYIKNQTLLLDAMILFETVKTILFGRGAR
ncbi:MAG: TIGR03013 family PEP-CTERM/XrtA system glycosyltransferase [Pyrinomonadaceae bacterium]|nr:TIGR03013 family PEP-CTERM/XrtA system glycosyltransferase [Pyrinomonadaceae bacterium]